jgi:hypothetical protein
MLRINTLMHKRSPGYEVKGIIAFTKKSLEDDEHLTELHQKLEKIIPGSTKAKYNLSHGELVISIKVEKASQAQTMLHKLNDFIKAAAAALKLT